MKREQKDNYIYTAEGIKHILISWLQRLTEDDEFLGILNSRNVSFLLDIVNEESKKIFEQRKLYEKEVEHVKNLTEIDYDE